VFQKYWKYRAVVIALAAASVVSTVLVQLQDYAFEHWLSSGYFYTEEFAGPGELSLELPVTARYKVFFNDENWRAYDSIAPCLRLDLDFLQQPGPTPQVYIERSHYHAGKGRQGRSLFIFDVPESGEYLFTTTGCSLVPESLSLFVVCDSKPFVYYLSYVLIGLGCGVGVFFFVFHRLWPRGIASV